MSCGNNSEIYKSIVSNFGGAFGLRDSIEDFTFRTDIRVGTFRYDPVSKEFSSINESMGSVRKTRTAYNGVVDMPTTTGGLLIGNFIFGNHDDKPVQIAVYDGNDISESEFNGTYFSSRQAVSNFIGSINRGGFALGTTRDSYTTNAFYGIVRYYAMLFDIFGRVGLTNSKHVLASVANIRFTNAFWTGFCMCYGNARDSGSKVKPLTAVDVCGHELTHGLQTFSTEFVYNGESGALNESIADVFGTFLEWYIDSPVDTPDWTLGEQFEFIIRDFADPNSQRQPKFYGGNMWADPNDSSYDNGGVHINSGVTNYLCYLAINGAKNFTTESGVFLGDLQTSSELTLREYTKNVMSILVSRKLSVNSTLKDFGRALAEETADKPYSNVIESALFAVGLTARRPTLPSPPDGSGDEDCDCGDTTHPPPPPPSSPRQPGGSRKYDMEIVARPIVGGSMYVHRSVDNRFTDFSSIHFSFSPEVVSVLESAPITISFYFNSSDVDHDAPNYTHVISKGKETNLSFTLPTKSLITLSTEVSCIATHKHFSFTSVVF